jgi:hypothetical protein
LDDSIVPRDRLLEYFNRKPKQLKGDKFLYELVTNANQRIYCSQLRYLFTQQGNGTQEFKSKQNFKEEDGFMLGEGWYERPVEITDKKTLDDCYKRLKQLDREQETIKDWNDYGRLQDIQDERKQILDFIHECTPLLKKKIKVIHNKIHDDYRAIYKAINRSIDLIAIDRPDLIPYIKEHLEIGLFCIWKEDI